MTVTPAFPATLCNTPAQRAARAQRDDRAPSASAAAYRRRRYRSVVRTDTLALDGGEPACARRPPLGKGIDALGEEEIAAVTAVLRGRTLFRYGRHESRVAALEAAVSEAFGCRYVLATSSGTAALRVPSRRSASGRATR